MGGMGQVHVGWRVSVRREPAPNIIDRRGNSTLYFRWQIKGVTGGSMPLRSTAGGENGEAREGKE